MFPYFVTKLWSGDAVRRIRRENVRLKARKRKTAAKISNTLRERERTGTLI